MNGSKILRDSQLANIKCEYCASINLEIDYVKGKCPVCHKSKIDEIIICKLKSLRNEYERLANLERLESETLERPNICLHKQETYAYQNSIKVQNIIIKKLKEEIDELQNREQK